MQAVTFALGIQFLLSPFANTNLNEFSSFFFSLQTPNGKLQTLLAPVAFQEQRQGLEDAG